MKTIIKPISFFMLTFLFVLGTVGVHAEEQSYKSNGQTSFYGIYEYDDKQEEVEQNHNGNDTNGESSLDNDTQQDLLSGQETLPKTGDSLNPACFYVGFILIGGAFSLIYINKRNEVIVG